MAKETTVLNVTGMSCGHCEHAVKKAVIALKGVTDVSVDLKSGKVTVEFDPSKTDTGKMGAAIEDAGYNVV
jgi:copper chaperone